jgi:long-chain fatty acid transport protein
MQKKLKLELGLRASRYLVAITFALASAKSVRAVGFLLPNQDPEAIGRGDAFAATADNPSAIYYNPAGITQLPGFQISAGVYAISAYSSFSSSAGSAHTDATPQVVPQIYATYSLTNMPISVGLGVYVPYGLSINWGDDAPFKSAAEKGNLLYLTVNPVIAWQICKGLSVGGGLTINYSQANFQNALPTPFTDFKFSGNDTEAGGNFGILWQPHRMWSFGVNYHSPTTMNYHGPASVSPPLLNPSTVYTTAAIHFPQYVTGGVSFRPTPNWNMEFDLEWTGWSSLQQISFENTPLGPQSITLNYRNSFIYDFGVTRQLGKGYYASVGYIYSENSSPNENFSPIDPDANLNLGNFGIGHRGKYWDWALAYQFAYNGGRTVSGNANPTVDGTYKTFNNALNASVTLKF